MKKLLMLIFATICLLSVTFSAPVYSKQYGEQLQEKTDEAAEAEDVIDMEQIMQAQEGAVAANEVLMEYFYRGGTETIYPEYFSGRYIEDNILYICYTGSLKTVKEELDPILGEHIANVKYKSCQYSYNYLMEHLSTTLVNLKTSGCNVVGYGLNEKNNSVLLFVDEETIQRAEKYLKDSFQFSDTRIEIEASGRIQPTINVYGGGDITVTTEDGNMNATLGICGKYREQYAFLTCGHYLSEGDTVWYNGSILGNLVVTQFENGESGDFSIGMIQNSNVYIPTHKVKGGGTSYTTLTGGTVLYPAQGTVVARYGAVTNASYGTITTIGVRFEISSSYYVIDLIRVSPSQGYTSKKGDSGGPIWSNGKFLGTFTGNDVDGNWYFSPYRYAQAAGFTAYASHDVETWSQYSSTSHSGYCYVCAANVLEAHKVLIWSQYSSSAHRGSCSTCSAYVTESHSAYLNSLGVCTRCGYSGTSVLE